MSPLHIVWIHLLTFMYTLEAIITNLNALLNSCKSNFNHQVILSIENHIICDTITIIMQIVYI